MKNKIIYINNDSLDPYFNFGLEYYLTTEKTFDDSMVLLFWRTSPTLMIGKYQDILEEINLQYVEDKEIQVVRRMSGGRTIYTDLGGWQYSFITKEDCGEIRFDEYISPVIDGLRELGIQAQFNGRNDLLIEGRRFSGAAQYMHNGFVVHHGSLLYGTNFEEMVRSTNAAEYKIISKRLKSVCDRVTNISDHLREPVGMEEFRRLMVRYLMGEMGEVYDLTSDDIKRIAEIADKKFRPREVIYGKNPKCNIIKNGQFQGGNETQINMD